MESPTLLVDGQLRLEQVSRLVTQKGRPRLTEEFVITKDGRYHGLGQTIDVLRLITEQQLQSAKHSNPLTLLPGNAALRSCIDRLIENRKRFVVAYFDLDSFKPYNDVYGYAQGDQVILHLAGLLKNMFSARLDFVAHVGGDDFIVVMRSADWRERVNRIIQRFAATVANFYSPEHAAAGHISASDRDEKKQTYPLLTVSVAALDSQTTGAGSADAVAHLLAHVKKLAKQQPGNSFILRSDERVVDLLAGRKSEVRAGIRADDRLVGRALARLSRPCRAEARPTSTSTASAIVRCLGHDPGRSRCGEPFWPGRPPGRARACARRCARLAAEADRRSRPLPDEIRRLPASAEVFKTYSELRRERNDAKSDSEAAKRLLGGLRAKLAPYYLDQVAARYRVAATTEESFRERLVHFWTNHFAVSADKPQVLALAGTLENEAIRPHVAGRFADMLAAVEAHPAMILYLDNQASIGPGSQLAQRRNRRASAGDRKLGINENLAREILELHTLGVDGGYTQQDVTTFAKALTGWSLGTDRRSRRRRARQVRVSRRRA